MDVNLHGFYYTYTFTYIISTHIQLRSFKVTVAVCMFQDEISHVKMIFKEYARSGLLVQ